MSILKESRLNLKVDRIFWATKFLVTCSRLFETSWHGHINPILSIKIQFIRKSRWSLMVHGLSWVSKRIIGNGERLCSRISIWCGSRLFFSLSGTTPSRRYVDTSSSSPAAAWVPRLYTSWCRVTQASDIHMLVDNFPGSSVLYSAYYSNSNQGYSPAARAFASS